MSNNEGLLCACDRRGGRLHDFGPDCGPRVYPARRDAPDLPPVGELVQITYRDGNPWVPDEERPVLVKLGHLDNGGVWWTVRDGDISSVDVISWCRVLVVPDSDDTRERLAAALVGQRPEHWARSRQLAPKVAALTLQQAGRALAALREAAIR